jgi:glycosyltransferase involved in cell wall biosynthesis
MQPRVIMVTGSSPPDACGVGDYTWHLSSALSKAGLHVELISHRQWDVRGTTQMIQRLSTDKSSLVHIQYPTMGYGYSLGPQLCALAQPCIVTLHEFSRAHILRKASLMPFTLRSERIVMTTDFERRSLLKKMPWAESRIQVIPIGSNIHPVPAPPRLETKRVLYHGLIMPHKGLEDFLALASLIDAKNMDWEFTIVGKIPERHATYASHLIESSSAYRVNWVLDRSAAEVGQLLSQGGIAYLPFPDGASERRSSLKAILASGIPCITRRTEMTPSDIVEAVALAETPQEALKRAVFLMNSNDERLRLSQAGLRYSRQFTWEVIADRHLQMYQDLFSRS